MPDGGWSTAGSCLWGSITCRSSSFGPKHEVHIALLEAGIIIVEGLDLRRVPPGRYNIACAPLKVVGAEGAPARVFLWDELPD